MTRDALSIKATLTTTSGTASYVSLRKLAAQIGVDIARLPHTIKILLENIARRAGSRDVSDADVVALAQWPRGPEASIAFMPARVLMQDFTGVPAVVDLAALRSAVARCRRRSEESQSIHPCRSDHRSLGAGRSLWRTPMPMRQI